MGDLGSKPTAPRLKVSGGPEQWLGTALVPPLTHAILQTPTCERDRGGLFKFFFQPKSKCFGLKQSLDWRRMHLTLNLIFFSN